MRPIKTLNRLPFILSLVFLGVTASAADDIATQWTSPGGISQVLGTSGLVLGLIYAVKYLVNRNETKDAALVNALSGTITEQSKLAVEVRDAMRDVAEELKGMRGDLQQSRMSLRKES